MEKIQGIFIVLFFVSDCCWIKTCPDSNMTDVSKYSRVEIVLSDVSKKITGFYYGQGIPENFNEMDFIDFLNNNYPDKSGAELIKKGDKIKARALGKGYSVMLCDEKTDKKLLEDFNCTLSKVDVRYWDKEEFQKCAFEENSEKYCR